MALERPKPRTGFWKAGKQIPIAPKYERAGTIGCTPLESFGLRESAASARKACRGGGPSPILPVHNGLQRRAGMRKIPHGALMALATAVGVLLFVQGRLLAIPTDERKADRGAINKGLSEQENAWNRGGVEAVLVGYLRSPGLAFFRTRGAARSWGGEPV